MDVVVEGNCFVSGRLEQCCIGIKDGRIEKIAKMLDGDRVHNYGSKLVLPAAIDSHVHFRDPGLTHKEDFRTGSLAAIHGGVTCVLDMPNTKPPTNNLAAIREKKRIADTTSFTDFGLFAGVQPNMDTKALTPEAVAFKLYMAGTTGGLLVQSTSQIKAELEAISKSGKVLAVHAEDEALRRKDPTENLEQHLRNRSNECEASAVRKIKAAAGMCRLHICHVSAKESIPLVTGIPNLTSEVTPHHLFLDKTCSAGTLAKVNPPLRRREDRQALFQALREGAFDTIASDHAPHTLEEKQEDFDYAPSGMPGVETMLPMMMILAKQNHLSLGGILKRMCERPGEIFGIRKGKLEMGFDADMIVVDMSAQSNIASERLHSKCGWTAYEGMPAIFPKAVFLRGEIMVENGSLVGERMGRDVVERLRTA